MTERTALLLVVILIAFLGVIAASAFYVGSSGVTQSAATSTATAVTPSLPDGESAPTPTARLAGRRTYTLGVGETVTAQGLAATLLAIVQDSRCPAGVECAWAGTVEARVRLAYGAYSRTELFELGVPKEALGYRATLTSVEPRPVSGTSTPLSAYRLHFTVEKQ